MAQTPDLPHFFEENINLEGLFDILSPKNNLVLACKKSSHTGFLPK